MTQTTPSTSAQWKLVPVEPTDEMVAAWPRFNKGAGHERDIYRAMLTASPSPAAAPASPSGVRVKPLEWVKDGNVWVAFGGFGQGYQIYESSADCVHRVMFSWSTKMWDLQAETLKAAKSAAQSDFEARILSALASDATSAPTSGSEDGGDWDSLTVHEKAVRSAWNYMQSPFSYSDDEKRFVFELLDDALAKPASEPAGGDVREALLLIRPVIAGLIKAEYNVETWVLKGRLAKIDDALGLTRVCEVCGGDCSAANPPPSYCPERDAALSSSAGPAVKMPSREWVRDKIASDPDDDEGEARPAPHPAPATVEMRESALIANGLKNCDWSGASKAQRALILEAIAALAPATEGRKS